MTSGTLTRLKTNDGPYHVTTVTLTFEQRAEIRELASRHGLAFALVVRLLLDDALTAGEAIVAEAIEASERPEARRAS